MNEKRVANRRMERALRSVGTQYISRLTGVEAKTVTVENGFEAR